MIPNQHCFDCFIEESNPTADIDGGAYSGSVKDREHCFDCFMEKAINKAMAVGNEKAMVLYGCPSPTGDCWRTPSHLWGVQSNAWW
jgi:hypothetical protein